MLKLPKFTLPFADQNRESKVSEIWAALRPMDSGQRLWSQIYARPQSWIKRWCFFIFLLLIVCVTLFGRGARFRWSSKSGFESIPHPRTRIGVDHGEDDLKAKTAELPICAKTFLYTFKNMAGFGSELSYYGEAYAAASLLNYSVIIDDSDWNYGKLSDYFDVAPLPCELPHNWKDLPRKLFSNVGGNQSDHVWTDRQHTEGYGSYLLEHVDSRAIDTHSVWNLQNYREQRTILPAVQNVHHTMKTIFDAKSEAFLRIWNPNKAVLEEIKRLKREMNERLLTLENQKTNFTSSDFSLESTMSRKLISIHFRLGDKLGENKDWTPAKLVGLKPAQANPHPYLEVVRSFVPDWKSSKKLPGIFLLSDDPQGALKMFDEQQSLYYPEHRFPILLPPVGASLTEHGHSQAAFNAAPLDIRRKLGIQLVRDVTFAVDNSEAIVCSSASNICNLMFHLRGSQDAIGPNATVRSVDVRWYPTEMIHQFNRLSLEPLGNEERIIKMARELQSDPMNYIEF
ncbi:hypothetical protein DFH28DRAFT_1102733 [Melampsora americana]|nr:hypothetical protein DFH28DRAFT_1102733 [Melampsora americana]